MFKARPETCRQCTTRSQTGTDQSERVCFWEGRLGRRRRCRSGWNQPADEHDGFTSYYYFNIKSLWLWKLSQGPPRTDGSTDPPRTDGHPPYLNMLKWQKEISTVSGFIPENKLSETCVGHAVEREREMKGRANELWVACEYRERERGLCLVAPRPPPGLWKCHAVSVAMRTATPEGCNREGREQSELQR